MRRALALLLLTGCGSSFSAADVAGDASADVVDEHQELDAGDVQFDASGAAEVLEQLDASADVLEEPLAAGDASAEACSRAPGDAPPGCGCIAAPYPGCEGLGIGCVWTFAGTACANECSLVPGDGGCVEPRDAAPPVDAGSPCPPAGCLCMSGGPSCPPSLPYVCNQGAECCNWRPPGC
jgi:hypothetical protein